MLHCREVVKPYQYGRYVLQFVKQNHQPYSRYGEKSETMKIHSSKEDKLEERLQLEREIIEVYNSSNWS